MEAKAVGIWAQEHFGGADLGHVRRAGRLVKLADACARGAGGTLAGVIRSSHQAKAAYRLLEREEVTHEAVIAPHLARVVEATEAPGDYLLIEDTTTLDYHGLKACSGLGPIGEPYTRGLWMHTCLALRADLDGERIELLGMLGQKLWARPQEPRPGRKSNGRGKESNHARQSRADRESLRWTEALARVGGPAPATRWIYVADRESDIFEVFQSCWAHGCSLVVRAAHPRALTGQWDGLNLPRALAEAPRRGKVEVEVERGGRTASLEVRSLRVELRGPTRPGGRLENHVLNVVEAREPCPPAGQEPLHWVLLTDLPVSSLAECKKVLWVYRQRPLIEDWHKALKTGLKIEASQLSSARRLMALAGVLSVVGVFLVQARVAASQDAQAPLEEGEVEASSLAVLRKLDPPRGPPTRGWLWVAIAKLGGFQARTGDGTPGWLTIWRGWQTLMVLVRGYDLAISSERG